jgi:uncharacterized transporter YbjL
VIVVRCEKVCAYVRTPQGVSMLAIVAAVLFGLALVFQLAGFAFGPLTAELLQTAGLLFVALYLAGIGSRTYVRAHTRRR